LRLIAATELIYGFTVEELMENVAVDPEDASHVLGILDWSRLELASLPPDVGDLTMSMVILARLQ